MQVRLVGAMMRVLCTLEECNPLRTTVKSAGSAEPEGRDCEGQHARQLAARLPDPSTPEGLEDGRVREMSSLRGKAACKSRYSQHSQHKSPVAYILDGLCGNREQVQHFHQRGSGSLHPEEMCISLSFSCLTAPPRSLSPSLCAGTLDLTP